MDSPDTLTCHTNKGNFHSVVSYIISFFLISKISQMKKKNTPEKKNKYSVSGKISYTYLSEIIIFSPKENVTGKSNF